MTLDFLITAFVVVIAPGTGVIYTIGTGLGQGRTMSLAAAFGCTLGIVPHILASVLGVAALLHASAVAFSIVKWVGVAYLIYLAVMTLKAAGPLRFERDGAQRSAVEVMKGGFLVNILNPKLSVFFLAFLPQFVPAGADDALERMLAMAAVFMAMTFVVFVIYGQFAGLLRAYVLGSAKAMAWVRRLIAITLGGMAARLALQSN